MNTSIQSARAILGNELVKAMKETCGNDERAYKEMLDEALRAFRIIRKDYKWKKNEPTEQE